MAYDSDELFANTAPLRLFLTAALPGAVGMLASALYDVADGIFVGQFLGESAFAAINLAMPFVIICFAFGDLIGVGSSVPISHALGRGDRDEANNIFSCSVIMIIATGAVLGLALTLGAGPLMTLMGAEGELHRMAMRYLQIYAFFSPITTLLFAIDNFLKISGHVHRSLMLNILMAVLGAVIEFTFLAVFGMGTWGAALAYCLSMSIRVFVGFWPFFRKRMTLDFVRPRFSLETTVLVVKLGMSTFLANVAGRIASIYLNMVLLAEGGEEAVSVWGVLMLVDGLMMPLVYGSIDALQPAVGYNWGAKRYDRVRALEKYCFIAAGVISLCMVALINLVPDQLTRLFIGNATPEFLQMARRAFRFETITYLTWWFSFAVQSYATAVGKPRMATVITFLRTFAFPVAATFALRPLGLTGVWLVLPISCVAAAVLAAVMLVRYGAELKLVD